MSDTEDALIQAIEALDSTEPPSFSLLLEIMYRTQFTGVTPIHWYGGIPHLIELGRPYRIELRKPPALDRRRR